MKRIRRQSSKRVKRKNSKSKLLRSSELIRAEAEAEVARYGIFLIAVYVLAIVLFGIWACIEFPERAPIICTGAIVTVRSIVLVVARGVLKNRAMIRPRLEI